MTAEFIGLIGKSGNEVNLERVVVGKVQELACELAGQTSGDFTPKIIVFTGAGSGYPLEFAQAARLFGISTYAFSPALGRSDADNLASINSGFADINALDSAFSGVVFLTPETNSPETVPKNLKANLQACSKEANLIKIDSGETLLTERFRFRSTEMADIISEKGGLMIVVGGGSGTTREILDALERNIPIFVLLESGGITGNFRTEEGVRNFLAQYLSQRGLNIENCLNLIFASSEPAELINQALKRIVTSA